jgi:hypothetical protein
MKAATLLFNFGTANLNHICFERGSFSYCDERGIITSVESCRLETIVPRTEGNERLHETQEEAQWFSVGMDDDAAPPSQDWFQGDGW